MRVEINYRTKTVKITNIKRLNNMLLNKKHFFEKFKEETKKYLETNENESMVIQPYVTQQNCSKREVYSNTMLPQETRKISNKLPKCTTKATRERRISKTQS